MATEQEYALVDQYHALRLGAGFSSACPVIPAQAGIQGTHAGPRCTLLDSRLRGNDESRCPPIVETPLRLRPERNCSYVRALWWIERGDGRSVLSVPPGAGEAVARALELHGHPASPLDSAIAEVLRDIVDERLIAAEIGEVNEIYHDLLFACNRSTLCRHHAGLCRRLRDDEVPPAEGIGLPVQCFPDGIAFGVIADGRVVSVAFAHRFGVMEESIADVGVVTAPAYRQRGYAKTAVSAVVNHVTSKGGEARYTCAPDNPASIAIAKSVGFVSYGTSLLLIAPFRKVQ